MKLGEILMTNGSISREQLNAALAAQKLLPSKKLGEILIDFGYIDEDTLNDAIDSQ